MLYRFLVLAFLGFAICSSSLADENWFAPSDPHDELLTIEFHDADLGHALKRLAFEINRRAYIDSEVKGSVSGAFREERVGTVLRTLLSTANKRYDFKFVGSATLVITSEKLADPSTMALDGRILPEGIVMRGVLLDYDPADRVVALLRSKYDNVEYTLHPTMNGFWVIGSKRDVARVRREAQYLDRK